MRVFLLLVHNKSKINAVAHFKCFLDQFFFGNFIIAFINKYSFSLLRIHIYYHQKIKNRGNYVFHLVFSCCFKTVISSLSWAAIIKSKDFAAASICFLFSLTLFSISDFARYWRSCSATSLIAVLY